LEAGLIGSKNQTVIASEAKQTAKFIEALLTKIKAKWLKHKIKDLL
jgi:hypothetical protein